MRLSSVLRFCNIWMMFQVAKRQRALRRGLNDCGLLHMNLLPPIKNKIDVIGGVVYHASKIKDNRDE